MDAVSWPAMTNLIKGMRHLSVGEVIYVGENDGVGLGRSEIVDECLGRCTVRSGSEQDDVLRQLRIEIGRCHPDGFLGCVAVRPDYLGVGHEPQFGIAAGDELIGLGVRSNGIQRHKTRLEECQTEVARVPFCAILDELRYEITVEGVPTWRPCFTSARAASMA
jgi:hypothetical protein